MTSTTADVRPDEVSTFTRNRFRFRDWRHRRPFWGGLLTFLAGLPILYFPYFHLSLGGLTFAMATTGGAGSLIIGILMMVLGITAWTQPGSRVFAGVAAILLSLVSIPVSNLGGFGLGLIPGLIGGGLMASWAPLKEQPADEEGALELQDPAAEVTAQQAEPADITPVRDVPQQDVPQQNAAHLRDVQAGPDIAPGEPGKAGEAR